MISLSQAITATIWLTVGLSWYGGDFIGQQMASGELYTRETGVWAAVPIEWVKAGYVNFGDTAFVIFADGRQESVPVLDTGCHLHHAAWDTGLPYGADFPAWRDWRGKTPTGTGRLAIRHKDGSWWKPPPLTAWGTRWCDGRLTQRPEFQHIPY